MHSSMSLSRLFKQQSECLKPNFITLSSSLAGRRPAREPAGESASELDSVMEFG